MTQASEIALVMDWGGTWSRAAVIDQQGKIHWQARIPNVDRNNKDRLLSDSEALLRQGMVWCNDRQIRIAGVGIAVAGPVDAATGALYDPPNLPGLNEISLKALWEPSLGYPVVVGNDANLAALGERRYGAGQDAAEGGPCKMLVYITVSTGIGGGVVDDGRSLLGAQGLAAEIGHMVIDWRAGNPICQCGQTGCLESLASGTAIARIARQRRQEPGWEGSTLAAQPAEFVTAETVFDAASAGDALAQSIVEQEVQILSVGLVNLLHIFNPDLVVLGGGVTNGFIQLDLLPQIRDRAIRRAMSDRYGNFRLVASKLGDDVGLMGAATLLWQTLGKVS